MSPALPVDELSSEDDDARRRLLLVALEGIVVALPASPLLEVLPARAYARLPGAPASVAGLANRRGRMITVVDLGAALDLPPAAVGDLHRIVVVSYGGRELGLAVKDVLQITVDWWTDPETDPEEDIEPEEVGDATSVDATRGSETGGDERLRVVELDAVFAPLFGGDAPASENQLQGDHELNGTDL